ncbi:MAG: putative nucleolar complex protein 2 [Streblomastix strix]|uniref:Putative nucleolar complex protein 2 n=1 Tax=Streblomastix strix TaxID=222440 RepID=A0A5J4UT19_9EUKA|nr:MAG: putative nucleolar complex protein 2 [Streblomastix strix]
MLCCQDDQTQLSASQFLRHLGALDQHSLEILLKAGFASVTSHFSTPYPDRFLQDCLINFFGINADESYNALFMLLRDMSNCLRGSISNTKESNESISVLFSWRHINRMRLIERIISTHIQSQQSSQSQQQSSQDNNNKQSFNNLRQLIYPLIEISLGAAQVASGSRLWPLRLHYTQIAIDSAQTIRSWTHSLYLLIEILQGSELRQPPKLKQNKKNINGRNSSKVVSKLNNSQKVQQFTKTSDIRSKNRVSKEIVGERSYQDSVVRLVIDQIYQITSTHASSLSFPELILPIFHFIRPLIKKMDSYENQKQLKALIAILTKNCEWICDIREKQNLSLGEQKIVDEVEYKLILSSSKFRQDSIQQQQQQSPSQSIQIPIVTKSNESIPPLTRFWKQKQIELKQNQIRLINAQKQAEDLINQKKNNDENQDQNNKNINLKQEEDEEVSNEEEEDSIKQNKPLNNRKRFRREEQEQESEEQEKEQSQGQVELLQLPSRNIIKKQLKRSLIEDKQREEKKIKLRNEKKKKKEFDLEKEQENIINKKDDNQKKNKKKFNQKQSNKNFGKNRFGNKQNIRRRFKARK